jgi:hypothetical protein
MGNRSHGWGRWVPVVLILALTGLTVHAGGDAKYKSPEDVFKAAKTAVAGKNNKDLCKLLTDDSVDTLAGALSIGQVMGLSLGSAFAKGDQADKLKAQLKTLIDLLAKHGLTEEAMKGNKDLGKILFDAKASPEDKKKALQKLVEPAKDRRALLADLLTFSEKTVKQGKDKGGLFGAKDAQLKEVEIANDFAKGMVVYSVDGKEKRDPLHFRRIAGSWRIEMPIEDMFKIKAGPKKG